MTGTDMAQTEQANSPFKVTDGHRIRLAVVYVRQSTLQQVEEHKESLARQYALAEHAAHLGWRSERILVIDDDHGLSGRTAEARPGFQRLLAEVTLDHVGLVLGLEMSRLARSCKDWHHLLDLCAVFGTLLADQDGLYDPSDPNDRLLLGLKGTISEVELQTMRSRLGRGKLNKARRGELYLHAPTGYVKSPTGQLVLDSDEQARSVIHLLFEKFEELGTAHAVFRYFREHDVRIGIRPIMGPTRGELEWRRVGISHIYAILRNPTYSGTYTYGRFPVDPKRKQGGSRSSTYRCAPMSDWHVILHDKFPAYISWQQYLENRQRLLQNCTRGDTRGHARNGSALLSGLVFCGRCGQRMNVLYNAAAQSRYDCTNHVRLGEPRRCCGLNGNVLDDAVVAQVLATLTPASIELSLRAAADLEHDRQRLHTHWRQELERARYTAQKAERAYRAVDPEHRLVARTLEEQWESALCAEQTVQENFARFQHEVPSRLAEEERERIRTLSQDIPALWHSAESSAATRKEIIRCLIDRVLVRVAGETEYVDITIQWQGGVETEHQLRRPVSRYEQLQDFPELRERLAEWTASGHTQAEIADRLNTAGFHPPSTRAQEFNERLVGQLIVRLQLSTRRSRPVELPAHEWWLRDLTEFLGVTRARFRHWLKRGYVNARKYGRGTHFIIWADGDELNRLRRLRDHKQTHSREMIPHELTTPKQLPKAVRLKYAQVECPDAERNPSK